MHVARLVIKDTPMPQRPVMTIGNIYAIVQEPEDVFHTVRAETETEAKVVKRGRRPAAKVNEAAETK